MRYEQERDERREGPRQEASFPSGSAGKKREPHGAPLHGDDPTLAKRAEEELRTSFGR